MATTDSAKIALKSTTKMSLNQRFQLLRQNQMRRQTNPQNSNKMIENNTSRLEMRQGSQRNRRLALQMANRPSVLAALRSQNPNQSNGSVKQRLGIKRFNNQTNAMNVNRNPNRRQINRSNFNTTAVNRNRNINQNRNITQNRNNIQNRNMTQTRRNNSQNIGVVVGVRRKGIIQRNRLRRTQTFRNPTNITQFKNKRRVGPQNRNQSQTKNVTKKKFQINRNFSGTRNQLGRQQNPQKPRNRRNPNVKPNREQLDNDLDAYMAGTKGHLDAELDAYMIQTN